jgi:predicted DNA-binding transcriptional regulator AlpA
MQSQLRRHPLYSDKHVQRSLGMRLLDPRTVFALVGLSRATIYRHMRQGRFPSPVIGFQAGRPKLLGWQERDIEAWVAGRDNSSPRTSHRKQLRWPKYHPRRNEY